MVATIKKARPDLLTHLEVSDVPIPEVLPSNHADKRTKLAVDNVEGIGQPITACFFTLSKVNPSKW